MSEEKANPTIPMIFKKIGAIQKDLEQIAKTGENKFANYEYRSIDDVYNGFGPVLAKHGVFVTSKPINFSREERKTTKQQNNREVVKVTIFTIVDSAFTFWAEDGSSVSTITRGEGSDTSDRSSRFAQIDAYKAALLDTFCVPTTGHQDTEHGGGQDIVEKQQPQRQQKPRQQNNSNGGHKPAASGSGPKGATQKQQDTIKKLYGNYKGADKKEFAEYLHSLKNGDSFTTVNASACIDHLLGKKKINFAAA